MIVVLLTFLLAKYKVKMIIKFNKLYVKLTIRIDLQIMNNIFLVLETPSS